MTSSALKAIATGKPADEPKDIAHLLAMPNVQQQIKAALPRHMTAERMARIATTEMRKVPKLGQCSPMSFLGAVIQCAQLGLEPGNALGHAYILPFDKREKVGGQWRLVGTEAQVIIGYRGMIDLARRSGQIISIDARAVFDGDRFECILGLDPKIEHTPDWNNAARSDPAKLRFVYAVAKLKDGGVQFDVMSRAEIEAIRKRSKASDNGPWVTDFPAMALKTVVRRLFKFLPVSVEIQRAVGIDELAEAGISQQNDTVLDGDYITPASEPGASTDDDAPPAKSYAAYVDDVQSAADAELASLILDEARSTLAPELFDELITVHKRRWSE